MNLDYSWLFYIMAIMPIILTISMLFITSLIKKKGYVKRLNTYKLPKNLSFIRMLKLEDYLSFEKYEVWRFTEHKKCFSKI